MRNTGKVAKQSCQRTCDKFNVPCKIQETSFESKALLLGAPCLIMCAEGRSAPAATRATASSRQDYLACVIQVFYLSTSRVEGSHTYHGSKSGVPPTHISLVATVQKNLSNSCSQPRSSLSYLASTTTPASSWNGCSMVTEVNLAGRELAEVVMLTSGVFWKHLSNIMEI